MSGFCNKLKADTNALKICDYLADQYNLKKSDFDTGLSRVVRPAGKDAYLKPGVPDGDVEAAEVYAKAMEYAEAEEDFNRLQVDTSYFESDFTFKSPLLSFLATAADMRIPWLFDDLEGDDRAEWIFPRVVLKMKLLKSMAKMTGHEEGTPEYERALAQKIFRFIETPKKGGMGIKFDEEAKSPQRNLMEVMDSHQATCIEFVNLYIAVARQAGLKVRPVEVYTDEEGDFVDHVKVAVELSNGDVVFFGLHDGEGLHPNEKWSFMSKSDLAAHDLNARSILNCAGSVYGEVTECKRFYLERALDLSPNHYMALYNLGHLSWVREGDLEASLEYFLKAREAYPEHPNTILNIKKVYSELGMHGEAEGACNDYKVITGKDDCE